MNTVAMILIRGVEGLFIAGLIGCTVVLVLTLIEDAETLFSKEK